MDNHHQFDYKNLKWKGQLHCPYEKKIHLVSNNLNQQELHNDTSSWPSAQKYIQIYKLPELLQIESMWMPEWAKRAMIEGYKHLTIVVQNQQSILDIIQMRGQVTDKKFEQILQELQNQNKKFENILASHDKKFENILAAHDKKFENILAAHDTKFENILKVIQEQQSEFRILLNLQQQKVKKA